MEQYLIECDTNHKIPLDEFRESGTLVGGETYFTAEFSFPITDKHLQSLFVNIRDSSRYGSLFTVMGKEYSGIVSFLYLNKCERVKDTFHIKAHFVPEIDNFKIVEKIEAIREKENKKKVKDYPGIEKAVRALVSQQAHNYQVYEEHVEFILSSFEVVLMADQGRRAKPSDAADDYFTDWIRNKCKFDNFQTIIFMDALRRYGFME